MIKYRKRIADKMLEQNMRAFGGALIEGVKGCEKATTAKQYSKSIIEFQNEDERDNLLLIVDNHPPDLY